MKNPGVPVTPAAVPEALSRSTRARCAWASSSAAHAVAVEPEPGGVRDQSRSVSAPRAANSASCISQKAPWAAAASDASAACCACGCSSAMGRWRNAKRSSSPMRERTRARIDCAAAQ